MASRDFLLPDLGEGLGEAEVSSWLVTEGDEVALNQPLVEVDTAKATVEIPSPFAGRIAKLHAAEGETLAVGAPLVTFDLEDDGPSGAGVGESAAPGVEHPPPAAAEAAAREGGPVTATPAVRRLAKDRSVDLSTIRGSGPGGRITREDVERAAGTAGSDDDEVELAPITPIRRAIAEKLTRAVREVPQVTTFRTVDCTTLEALRAQLGLSPLPIVVRALAEVCAAHPMLHASYRPDEGMIRVPHRCHVGIATDTERGLVVPVVRDVGSLGLAAIADEIRRLAEAARGGSLGPADMRGGTITVTNTGSYGSEQGTPIVNPPEAAILALGAIAPRALVVENRIEARPACTLSLTFDHRVLDGAAAGRAVSDLVDLLEDPERLGALPR